MVAHNPNESWAGSCSKCEQPFYYCQCHAVQEYCPIHNPIPAAVRCTCSPKIESEPHKCPVCEGRGEVKQTTYTSTTAGLVENHATHATVTCHGCNGKGWVTV